MMHGVNHQMGSLNALGMGGMNPSSFVYVGNVIGLQTRLQDVKNQPVPYTDANIVVTGNQIKEYNICCLFVTILLGSFFILPLFLMCCGWWKKMVNPAWTVPLSTYQKLQAIIFSPTIRSVTLSVCDSTFDKSKATLLYNMLSRSSIKGFDFLNRATPNDFNSNQWSDFTDNMKPIKSLPFMTDIKWYDQIVL